MTLLRNLTIKKFHEGLLKKKFSALEITQAFLKYIKDTDASIGAYLNLNDEYAIREAEMADLAIAKGEKIGNLAGVPLALKDVILYKGLPTTAGSKILEHYVASYDAHVVTKLKAERAVVLGKTNQDEFAMGSSNENSAFHPTKNPVDLSRVPGGSSGGSAAAVAGHMAIAALGSDTGGSIRQPAAFCGVVGLKPTYGAVSRSGLIAMSSSLDQIGPLTKTVEDAAILFRAIAGYDANDATSSQYYDENNRNDMLNPDFERIKQLRVGIPKEYFGEGISPEVRAGVESVIAELKAQGIRFKEISLPHSKYALSCYYIIMPAEVSSNLARFDGIRYAQIANLLEHDSGQLLSAESPRQSALTELYLRQRGRGFGAEAKRRIMLGTFVLSSGYYDAYYAKAQQVRALIKKDFTEAFSGVDIILSPVTPTTAFKFGEKTDDPMAMYLSDIFTIPANLAGVPAISIPVRDLRFATSDKQLPIGFQLIGKHFREADVLGMGRLYENRLMANG
jgi:aspartyl-tRNA(Asn)/glutamyl-tRNA(Gln) amidotransferase subunit A